MEDNCVMVEASHGRNCAAASSIYGTAVLLIIDNYHCMKGRMLDIHICASCH